MTVIRSFMEQPFCNLNVILVGIAMPACYFVYLFFFLYDLKASFKFFVIPISIVSFILLYWSFLRVYLTEPGRVPTFWAVDIVKTDIAKQRKYCLVCNNFKPERTHHCSTCRKCVLNMDHHCPWVNNCIGLYNKKFFIHFLVYLIINILFVLPQQAYLLTKELIPIIHSEASFNLGTFIRLLFFILELFLLFPIVTFVGFHFSLIFKNQTTLEEMAIERSLKKNKPVDLSNPYDMGDKRNFRQVFGKKCWQWIFPVAGRLPIDGINWPRNDEQQRDIMDTTMPPYDKFYVPYK